MKGMPSIHEKVNAQVVHLRDRSYDRHLGIVHRL